MEPLPLVYKYFAFEVSAKILWRCNNLPREINDDPKNYHLLKRRMENSLILN